MCDCVGWWKYAKIFIFIVCKNILVLRFFFPNFFADHSVGHLRPCCCCTELKRGIDLICIEMKKKQKLVNTTGPLMLPQTLSLEHIHLYTHTYSNAQWPVGMSLDDRFHSMAIIAHTSLFLLLAALCSWLRADCHNLWNSLNSEEFPWDRFYSFVKLW